MTITIIKLLPFLESSAALQRRPNSLAIPSCRSNIQERATSGEPLAVTCNKNKVNMVKYSKLID